MILTKEILSDLAKEYGNAFYLLDSEQFEKNFDDLCTAFKKYYSNFNIAYSYKTNYTPKLCKIIDKKGGYAEVVSDMEMEIALKSGVSPTRIIWNGPIKNYEKVFWLLLNGGTVNIDNNDELEKIASFANNNREVTFYVGLRCNYDVGDGVISRFGMDTDSDEFVDAVNCIKESTNMHLINLQCHFAKRSVEYWPARAKGMVAVVDKVANVLGYVPDRVDLGGGIYGNMHEDLKKQFSSPIPSYDDYAEAAAKIFAAHFGENGPELLVEPGSALAGDCMKFVGCIENIKSVRGKHFAAMLGSQKNISMSGVNPPMEIYKNGEQRADFTDLDIVGYTCIEGDVLFSNYSGDLAVGDFVVFSNCGSYSLVMKPPFIMPNFPVLDIYNSGLSGKFDIQKVELIKRAESFEDLFATFSF